MNPFTFIADKLVNVVANLGTDRDKADASYYATIVLTDEQLINAYRTAWLPRKIVDIPAQDCTSKWRGWQADNAMIQAIEAEEIRLSLKIKVRDAMTRARLFGGSAIFIGTGDQDLSKPLDPESVGKGGIKYLNVMSRRNLNPVDIERDPQSDRYGLPTLFAVTGSSVHIHHTRLAIFIGAPFPDPEMVMDQSQGWGDSILTAIMDAIIKADSTMANVAALVFEAKVDVIRVPDLMRELEQNPRYEKLLLDRLRLAATAKGINGMLLLDKEEEYDSKSANFSNLPEIIDRFFQMASGAADIPATRLLGQSPSGLNSTGESDMANYYDRVKAMQTLEVGPSTAILDECLIRSALGSRPAEVYYVWNSLWQPNAKETAEIGKLTAETVKVLVDTMLFPTEAMSQAAATMLVEHNIVPGLESALEDWAEANPDGEDLDGEDRTIEEDVVIGEPADDVDQKPARENARSQRPEGEE